MADHDADVIIIGAGHNSLTAALYLQKAGHSVLIIELAKVAGGAAKTAEIVEPGCKHDLYATNVGQFLGSRVYADFKDAFHRHGFSTIAAELPFANVFPDKKCIRMYTNPEKTSEEFGRFSAGDRNAWKKMVAYFENVSPFLFPILQLPVPSGKMLIHFWKMYRSLGVPEMLNLFRILLTPARQFADSWFESREAKALITPWAFHLGLSPDCAGGATFCFLESVADHLQGLSVSRGGVGRLIDAMVTEIEAGGGQFLMGQRVTSVLVKQGRARGVETADGQSYYAKKAVLGNVTPNQFLQLVPEQELPGQFLTGFRNYRFGPGTVMIHLTLNKPLTWDAADDLADGAYVTIGPYVSDISATYAQIMKGLIPAEPLLVVAHQSRLDPERATDGRHVMSIQVRSFPARPSGDALGKIQAGSWDSMKEPIFERVIDKVAQYSPDIRENIRKWVMLTPEDLERDDPNLVGGDNVGGSHHIDQFFFFRPVGGWSRYKTPVRRLYLTGQSTWPGCGLNASAGYLAAMEMVKDL